MATCECSSLCSFYNETFKEMPKTAEYFKKKYCDGEFGNCARFKASQVVGIRNVPDYLYPVRFKSPKCFQGL